MERNARVRCLTFRANGNGGVWRRRAATGTIVVATLMAMAGCDAPMVKVTGTVTLDDTPLSKGMVFFHPPEDAGLRPAASTVSADGRYELTSAGGKSGAQVGAYRVTVHGSDNTSEDAQAAALSRETIPPQYGNVDTTPLTVKVVEGDNTIDLQLKR